MSEMQKFEQGSELNDVDLRYENEVFADHERIDNGRDTDDELAQLRDTLAEDSDGIIHLDIPAYAYDFSHNPFVGMGPKVVKTYEISRYLDVVFLHRYMYQDIVVYGIRSREFVSEVGRAAFVKHIRDTGGVPINCDGDDTIYALHFTPFMNFHSTGGVFRLYHTIEPHSREIPHYPIDVWMIFDANAYEAVSEEIDFRRSFRLKDGYDRRASLIGLAQIN